MRKSPAFQFLYIICVGLVTVVVSYLLGYKGLEAFYTTAFSLTILLMWLLIQAARNIFRQPMWLILKILFMLPLFVVFIFGLSTMILSTPANAHYSINGWLVAAGIIPYLIPRIGLYKKSMSATSIFIGLAVTFVSIQLLFMAFQGFQMNPHGHHKVLLILAVQIQLAMTYLASQTNFLRRSRSAVLSWCQNHGIEDDNVRGLAVILTTGLPFLVPIFAVFYLAL